MACRYELGQTHDFSKYLLAVFRFCHLYTLGSASYGQVFKYVKKQQKNPEHNLSALHDLFVAGWWTNSDLLS